MVSSYINGFKCSGSVICDLVSFGSAKGSQCWNPEMHETHCFLVSRRSSWQRAIRIKQTTFNVY
jgi:hypothetical protein